MAEPREGEDHGRHHRGKSSASILDRGIILANLGIAPGEKILDAGCGDGYMAKEFARITGDSGRVYALDPDPVSIEKLKTETEDTVVEAFVGDITRKTELEASSLDLVYLSTVVHGFSEEDFEGFVNEVKRLLKPGGRLAIVEINKQATPFGPPPEMRFSPEDLKDKIDLLPVTPMEVGPYFYLQIFRSGIH